MRNSIRQILEDLRKHLPLCFLLLLAIPLRFLFLTWKAPHFDEGINGFFVLETWRKGFFPYDPSNFHGPLYFYFLQLSEQIFGRGIFSFRFITAVFSTLIVVFVYLHKKFLGRAAIWAAAFVALSPGFIFYGRYAIHESLFVLSQVIFSYFFLSYLNKPNEKSIWMICLATTACFATKETAFIFLFCYLFAFFLAEMYEQYRISKTITPVFKNISASVKKWKDTWMIAALASALIIVLLFTGLFAEPQRLVDFFKAYSFWTKTGTGHLTGHEKPYYYWLSLLQIYEWPAFAGLVVSPILLFFGSKVSKALVMCALGLLVAYSIIPYKTPWCILGILWPLLLALGISIEEMRSARFFKAVMVNPNKDLKQEQSKARPILVVLAVVLCLISFCQSLDLNFIHYHDAKEKYVYVQSFGDLNEIMIRIRNRVAAHPEDLDMKILLGMKTTWPLPWLLADYTGVGYREISDPTLKAPIVEEQAKALNGSDVILIDEPDVAKIERQLTKKFIKAKFALRDAYNGCVVYLSPDKFTVDAPANLPGLNPEPLHFEPFVPFVPQETK